MLLSLVRMFEMFLLALIRRSSSAQMLGLKALRSCSVLADGVALALAPTSKAPFALLLGGQRVVQRRGDWV